MDIWARSLFPASGSRVETKLLSICLFKQAQGLFHVVGLLPERFRIPFASLGSKEITSESGRACCKRAERVGPKIKIFGPESPRILPENPPPPRRFNLATREPPPKDIVLAARVNADNGPHLMVVGRDCHPRSP